MLCSEQCLSTYLKTGVLGRTLINLLIRSPQLARLRRVVAPKLPHHVTQRGNQKAHVYRDRQDREVYLRLLLERSRQHSFDILCYCLMTNHIHLVMVPHQEDSLNKGLRDTQGPYATYFNRKYDLTGHLWQGRFYSCLLDGSHLWAAER